MSTSPFPSPAAPQPGTLNRQTLKVLVVDDDAFQLDLISEILKSLGVHDITTASSGAQALDRLGANPERFDLMLLDLLMPGMDGFQFMDSAARAGFSGGLIIVSGQRDEVLHAAAMVAKLQRFRVLGSVNKPVSRADLARLI
jgi:CheY-like chemotaxis protein